MLLTFSLMSRTRAFLGLCLALVGLTLLAQPVMAATCSIATAQGSTGPANYHSYCWIDFTGYNDASARSAGGQNFSVTLQDGTVMTFRLNVSGAAITAAISPAWSGAAVGNTAFIGIAGRPIVYQTAAGTTTLTLSNIVLTPPAGAPASTTYMMVGADGESSNNGELMTFQTNGGGWQVLGQAGPISGSTYPTISGTGTSTFTETGVAGTVGAYIVGSTGATTLTTTMVGGGLQGSMFAVRFASIRLNTQISGTRANAADQFTYTINATSSGTTIASATSTGTGNGPFSGAALSSSSSLTLSMNQAMAGGSVSTISHYRSVFTCTNSTAGSSTSLPTNVTTTSYNLGSLQFGDAVSCIFTETPFPHLTLRKMLGATGRQYAADQFVMAINQGASAVATTTTAGTGAVVTNGVTAQYQATVGLPYNFSESGAGMTSLAQYTAGMACANGWGGSSTVLATAPGGTITPQMGDVITCTITNTKVVANAQLTIAKSSTPVSDPVSGTINPKLIPGAVVKYSFLVRNTGTLQVDNNTVWLIDALPANLQVGTAATPVFTQGTPTSGLTFNPSTDIAYSNAAGMPTSFAQCTYTPTAAYDPNVRYVCLNPKGTMAGSSGTPPSFQLSINALIN